MKSRRERIVDMIKSYQYRFSRAQRKNDAIAMSVWDRELEQLEKELAELDSKADGETTQT